MQVIVWQMFKFSHLDMVQVQSLLYTQTTETMHSSLELYKCCMPELLHYNFFIDCNYK